jgi:DNA repair protein RecN (Recombination protein N)
MLLELAIRDFAIIRDLRITFTPGFNALTGETGAGKSIIIDALGAVLGARVSSDLVRTGATSAWVEALFDAQSLATRDDFRQILTDTGLELEDGCLILSRDINANGRSVARINGRTVTAGTLATVGEYLVDIHGQSEHLSLLRPSVHLGLLDHYAAAGELRDQFAALYRQYEGVARKIDEIRTNERERAQRLDMLRFQADEIESARLSPTEEEELEQERTVLANAERLALLAAEAYQLLDGGDEASAEPVAGALDNLRAAVERVDELARIDRENEELAGQLREAQFLLEEYALSIRSYADRLEADPERLEAIEDRLALLKQLKRKYGATIADVIAYLDRASEELHDLENSEQHVEGLREQAGALRARMGSVASSLSERRRSAAPELKAQVEQAMLELNMGRAQFEVEFGELPGSARIPVSLDGTADERPFDATGVDRVEFLIAPNAGEAPKALGRIASGGEMARLMLALKSILSSEDATPTLVFDEVDVGVGGRSGQPVGEKLWGLGERHQVLVISHLAQVAAFAETHFKITKLEEGGRTETRIDRLDAPDRLDELAAMLDGHPPTEESRQNARAMLERIEQWKRERSAAMTAARA